MTVKQYREQHPNCKYCNHVMLSRLICPATRKIKSKKTAKNCPCYLPVGCITDVEDCTNDR